ncbi:MAG: hypothetical protein RL156_610 [Bacteroidota bacterium]|jgi:hypothetical protein
MNSCTGLSVKHVNPRFVSGIGRDSVNRMCRAGTITLKTRTDEHTREPGYVQIIGTVAEVRSKILFDTLRIPIDSLISLQCVEDLPLGTTVMAALGGAGAGYAIGRATGESWNSEFPIGLAVIGGGIGGFVSFLSSKETMLLIDPLAPMPAPAAPAPAPPGIAPRKRR